MENGRVGFKARDVADLLTLYGVTSEQARAEMLQLAQRASTPGEPPEVLGALATLNGLAREGRVGKRGLPRIPFSLWRRAGFT